MIARLFSLALLAAIAGCMSAHPPLGMPDSSVMGFDGSHAVPPDCATLMQPSHLVDAGFGRPGVAFGCATYTNLAVMLARPADLVAPVPYAGADAALGASAVRRYEEGRATPLNSTSTTTNVVH
jgi:type IV pilus biogenesis protein CpaD/CtpE